MYTLQVRSPNMKSKMMILKAVWNFVDPAYEGSAYMPMKRSKKRSPLVLFSLRRRLGFIGKTV